MIHGLTDTHGSPQAFNKAPNLLFGHRTPATVAGGLVFAGCSWASPCSSSPEESDPSDAEGLSSSEVETTLEAEALGGAETLRPSHFMTRDRKSSAKHPQEGVELPTLFCEKGLPQVKGDRTCLWTPGRVPGEDLTYQGYNSPPGQKPHQPFDFPSPREMLRESNAKPPCRTQAPLEFPWQPYGPEFDVTACMVCLLATIPRDVQQHLCSPTCSPQKDTHTHTHTHTHARARAHTSLWAPMTS